MRNTIIAIAIALTSITAIAQANMKSHKVVFELTSKDSADWQAVLNNVENLQSAFGAGSTNIEVVTHGGSVEMLRKTNAGLAERLQHLANIGVVFAACNNTMRRSGLTRDDMFPFVTVVDSGVAEVVRKQEEGWSYVKVGR